LTVKERKPFQLAAFKPELGRAVLASTLTTVLSKRRGAKGDEAIQKAVALNCFASLAKTGRELMTNDGLYVLESKML
jgi:hypothetical protein